MRSDRFWHGGRPWGSGPGLSTKRESTCDHIGAFDQAGADWRGGGRLAIRLVTSTPGR
jgi:hypothetical protein